MTCVIRISTLTLSHTISCSITCMFLSCILMYSLTHNQPELVSQLPHASWTSAHETSPHQSQNVLALFSQRLSTSSSSRNSARHSSATSEKSPPKSSMSANKLSMNSQSFSTSSQCSSKIIHLSPASLWLTITHRAQRAKDEPKCEQLKEENAAVTAQLLAAKEVHTGLTRDIEALKIERAHLQARNETVNSEAALLMDSNSRTRSRIVQSPERIKRNIVTMGATAIEDKRLVALHEAKARDLQAKITALVNIEKVISFVMSTACFCLNLSHSFRMFDHVLSSCRRRRRKYSYWKVHKRNLQI